MATHSAEILARNPLYYWRMGNAIAAESSLGSRSATMNPGASTAAPTVASGIPVWDGYGWAYDGSNDYASASGVNLSDQTVITLTYWLWKNSFVDNDALCLEHSSNANLVQGAWHNDPGSTAMGGGKFEIASLSTPNLNAVTFTRPSAAAWHYYAVVMRRGVSNAAACTVYVDGSSVSVTSVTGAVNALTGNYRSDTLYAMSRGGASLFTAGRMAELAIFSGDLGSTAVAAIYAAAGNTSSTHHMAATTFPLSVSLSATAKRRARAVTSFSLSLAYSNAAKRRARAAATLPLTLGATATGKRRARVSSALALTVGLSAAARRRARAAAALGLTLGLTASARRRARASATLPLTLTTTPAARRKARAGTTLALQLGTTASVRRKVSAAATLALTLVLTAAARIGLVSPPRRTTHTGNDVSDGRTGSTPGDNRGQTTVNDGRTENDLDG